MKILFDHQKFSTQRYGGISRYFANIINAIKIWPEFAYSLGVICSQNHYIKDHSRIPQALAAILSNPKYASKINQLYCSYLLKQNDYDIFHPTYYDTYLLDKLKKPLVITIHDMTYERFPEYFWAKDPLTKQKRLNVERADKIIAISETTKKDLIKYLDVDAAKIDVVYHGIDLQIPFTSKAVNNLPERYLLFVGDRSGYKNFYLFINTYKRFSVKHPDIKLVLTGGGNLDVAETECFRRLNITEKVLHINASDEELNYLYQKAIAFVYPSLHEGFGLPILEAFMAKCPMILSDTACFREIAQDAAVYFAPYDEDDLLSTLKNVVESPDLRTQLVLAGNKRIQDFSLDKSIKETFDIYRSLS